MVSTVSGLYEAYSCRLATWITIAKARNGSPPIPGKGTLTAMCGARTAPPLPFGGKAGISYDVLNARCGCVSEKRSVVFTISQQISHSRLGVGWLGGVRAFVVNCCYSRGGWGGFLRDDKAAVSIIRSILSRMFISLE